VTSGKIEVLIILKEKDLDEDDVASYFDQINSCDWYF